MSILAARRNALFCVLTGIETEGCCVPVSGGPTLAFALEDAAANKFCAACWFAGLVSCRRTPRGAVGGVGFGRALVLAGEVSLSLKGTGSPASKRSKGIEAGTVSGMSARHLGLKQAIAPWTAV